MNEHVNQRRTTFRMAIRLAAPKEIEAWWRAAAFDYLHACFTGTSYETIRELADIFGDLNFRQSP